MKISAIILARMGSSRLPGKVLMGLQGKPVLQRIIERCRTSVVDDVIVATTTKDRDTPIVELCEQLDTNYFRGSENKPLDRVYFAAKEFNVDLIVDVTGDCPLVDPGIIDSLVSFFGLAMRIHYASNVIERKFPDGFDCQVYKFQALQKIYELSETTHPEFKEYVGWNFTKLDKFYTHSLIPPLNYRLPEWRLTLDTRKDYELINWIYSAMKDEIWSYKQIIDFLNNNIMEFLEYRDFL